MRKAISLILASMVLCLSTSALATVETQGRDGSGTIGRNNQSALYSGSYSGTGAINTTMPGFRPGDTISFDVTGVTSGNEMTLICYKYGAESDGLISSEVSYINQYTLSAASQKIDYTIPSGSANGVYKVVINDSSNPVANFYYKVGTVTAELISSAEGANPTQYRAKQFADNKWSIGFIGKVTVKSSDVTLAELGATPGFEITDGSVIKKYGFGVDGNKTVGGLQNVTGNAKLEVSGGYAIIYGLTMYNVPNGTQDDVRATATTDAGVN